MKRSNYVYLAITNDELELPIAMFDNLKQLAKYAETGYQYAWCMISKKSLYKKLNCYFIKVYVGECE